MCVFQISHRHHNKLKVLTVVQKGKQDNASGIWRKKMMLQKFCDAYKEKKIYQTNVRKKPCYRESSGQMNGSDDEWKIWSSGEG